MAHTGSEESDGTLLYYMSCRGSPADIKLSDVAAREFHRRHMRALFARCARICRNAGAAHGIDTDLAQMTLAKAVQRADTFKDPPGLTPSDQARHTQAWLGSITHNLLIDSIRNPNRPGPLAGATGELPAEDYSDAELAALLCDGHSLPRDNETIRLVREALPTLPLRTQAVLIQTVLQRKRSPHETYMYRGSAAALAAQLGTTPENVRRIRMMGLKALASYVQSHSRGTPK